MNRSQIVALLGGSVGLIAAAYFAFLASDPMTVAGILMRRGYDKRGWTQQRLAARVRMLSILGAILAVAAILLAIFKFIR